MKAKEIIGYVKSKVSEYPRIDSIIECLELKKDTQKNKDINSFIRSKNKVNNTVEIQAIKNMNIDNKIEEYQKWQSLIANELEEIKKTDVDIYKVVNSKFAGATFDDIENETFIGRQRAIRLYNDFIVDITIIALVNKIILIEKY